MNLVISANTLRRRIGIKNLLLVDTRPFSNYSEGHIPGAVNIDLMQFHWIDTSKGGIRQFSNQMRLLLSNIGVSSNKWVVFYDDVSGPSAARGVWLLLYFSHKKVAMLDGGFNRWKAKGFAVQSRSIPFAHSTFRGKPNPNVLADFRRVHAASESGKSVIIDARTKAEFEGSTARAARIGHIPGAVNVDWIDNLKQDSFKGLRELERLYHTVPKDSEIITYCQGGYRAANTFVVLKSLGYEKVRMYLGSWGEWGNRHDLPVSRK